MIWYGELIVLVVVGCVFLVVGMFIDFNGMGNGREFGWFYIKEDIMVKYWRIWMMWMEMRCLIILGSDWWGWGVCMMVLLVIGFGGLY